jgi:peptidoglycan/LPS O-acetylase OafA/YrhL
LATIAADISVPLSARKTTPVYLGSYRFLLALFVFATHSSLNLVSKATHSDAGNIGVLCFFVVSGYLITVALEAHYSENVWRFLINRFLRIYPALWISLGVAVLIILSMHTTYVAPNFFLKGWSPINIVQSLLVVTAYPNTTWGPMPVGWTLQVEVSFYLVMAALYLAFGRNAPVQRGRLVMIFCTVSLLANAYVTSRYALWWSNGILFIPFFAAGVATAILSRIEREQIADRLFAMGVLVLAVVFCINLLIRFSSNQLIPPLSAPIGDFIWRSENGLLIGTLLTSSGLIGTFFILVSPSFARNLRPIARTDELLGDLTYPLYTIHYAINQWIIWWASPRHAALAMPLQFVTSLGAAYLILRYVDRPLRRLRTRVRGAEVRE